ncbi:MAG: TIR domain-containing protein [Planctomycetaceae bacterium]|nr:TIR domain-containing protein [Planctomycetaceae bacterium]
MKVFISWSRDFSKSAAEVMKTWLSDMFTSAEIWMSAHDIKAGSPWATDLYVQLAAADFGILCLTRENLNAPWILYEAGCLVMSVQQGRVIPYLIDASPQEVQLPLSQLQAAAADRNGTRQLVEAINSANDFRMSNEQLHRQFEKWWPDLEVQLNSLRHNTPSQVDDPVLHQAKPQVILPSVVREMQVSEKPFSKQMLQHRFGPMNPGLVDSFPADWSECAAQFQRDGDTPALHARRIRLADEVLVSATRSVARELNIDPGKFCLVARGGYGSGRLSAGSDIDITFFHEPKDQRQAEQLHGRLMIRLNDAWSPVGAVLVSPLINTLNECEAHWVDPEPSNPLDLSLLSAFTASRFLYGRRSIHDTLRHVWRRCITNFSREKLKWIVSCIEGCFARKSLQQTKVRFDIKFDAGGLLEHSLCEFVTELLTTLEPDSSALPEDNRDAYWYLLWLREKVFRENRSHVLTEQAHQSIAMELQWNDVNFQAELYEQRTRVRERLIQLNLRLAEYAEHAC